MNAQSKIDSAIIILTSIKFPIKAKYQYGEGASVGSVLGKIKVARELLQEVAKEINDNGK